jgi:hypothetical protein
LGFSDVAHRADAFSAVKKLRLIVVGTMASEPYAGMAWMNMQIVVGLHRLGHDVYYFETSSTWPYDPVRGTRVRDSEYAVPYLERVASEFGLAGRWAYRRSYLDKEWLGLPREKAEDLLASADAVFNIGGASRFAEEGLQTGPLIYFGTDPVYHELAYAEGNANTREIVNEHDASVTYGENIGTEHCVVPPLPRLRARTRQPVLMDLWSAGPPSRRTFTTVGNWKQDGRDVQFLGETYLWSKHHEFLKFIDLPLHVEAELELATNLADPSTIRHGVEDVVKTMGMDDGASATLLRNGWNLVSGSEFTREPWAYRDYIQQSRGEFTVGRDLNVRLRSGWFSERSACYLAAGRPVITQDTGFGTVLPTGEGLFAFNSMDAILAAFEAVERDYERQSCAAQSIAEEYFRAETVLGRLLDDLGL